MHPPVRRAHRRPLAPVVLVVAVAISGCFNPDAGTADTNADASTSSALDDASTSAGAPTTASSTNGVPDPDDTGASDPSSTGTAESGDESTGPEPGCCVAGCSGACVSLPCAEAIVGEPTMGMEAISVAVTGEFVVWSSGLGKSLYVADLGAGTTVPMAFVPENAYITEIAADDTHVYFLDNAGPTVRRATVPLGTVDVVTQVAGGAAGFGGLAVSSTHVYFAMGTTGGIHRAAKDLTDVAAAELVATSPAPGMVAVDATHVYWTEWTEANGTQVRRFPFDAVGATTEGTTVATGTSFADKLAIDETHVYFSDGDAVKTALKNGTNQGLLTLASGQSGIRGLAVDAAHVYWTTTSPGAIGRAAKDGSGEPEQLTLTEEPWGLALGCDAVYWASNGQQQSLRTAPK